MYDLLILCKLTYMTTLVYQVQFRFNLNEVRIHLNEHLHEWLYPGEIILKCYIYAYFLTVRKVLQTPYTPLCEASEEKNT